MRADRLALIGTGLHGIIGVDAKMVRPEPHQALGEADFRPDAGIVMRLGLAKEILLHRRFGLRGGLGGGRFGVARFSLRRLLHRGVFHRGILRRRICCGEFRGLLFRRGLPPRLKLLLGGALGNEVGRHAARRAAAHQAGIRNAAGIGPVEVADQRAARIGRDCRNGAGAWSEAEPMQGERRSPGVEGHDESSLKVTCSRV